MPRDYGVRPRMRSSRGLRLGLGLLLALAVVAAAVSWNYLSHRRQDLAEGWIGDRPACPAITAAAYAAKGYARGERASAYEETTFARQFGHMECKDVVTQGGFGFLTHPVCQFSGPAALRVKASGGEAFFEPGVGRIATVSIEHGRASCALGGKFSALHGPS
ncbi:MAG: hypothetical protein ACXWKO_18610 [Phenylobacterium sp.]